MCFSHLQPHPSHPPPALLPPTPRYAHPEISAHLLKSHENQATWIFEVMQIKANTLVSILIVNGAQFMYQLVFLDEMLYFLK